jgi:ABC-type antimicrobial peptide transport system permease subunit
MLLAGASATATAIGAFGLFAILLSFVGMRRREIGVRLALGATRTNVRWLVAATSLRLVGLGAGIGLLGSLLTSKALSSYLYGVSTLDPLTFAAVLGLLATLGLGAALLPASRAATVDPAGELRAE